jgi:hypothetical protein
MGGKRCLFAKPQSSLILFAAFVLFCFHRAIQINKAGYHDFALLIYVCSVVSMNVIIDIVDYGPRSISGHLLSASNNRCSELELQPSPLFHQWHAHLLCFHLSSGRRSPPAEFGGLRSIPKRAA